MFAGFKLSSTDLFNDYKTAGENHYKDYERKIEAQLDRYINKDGNLNGTVMQNDWFPELDANVFISHSHDDMDQVFALAGWLHKKLGLTVFIDSCVWGHSNKLLRAIDDEYCMNESGDTYNYIKRNYSTSHVHMMLSTALTKMIDKTECVFFLDTPQSISASDAARAKTKSPWIYHELAVTSLIRKKTIKEHRKHFMKGLYSLTESAKALHIDYDVTLDHLIDLSHIDLQQWLFRHNQNKDHSGDEAVALDSLYRLKITAVTK